MIWQLDLLILTLIILCAFAAIMLKDMLSAAIIFGAYSFLLCLIWLALQWKNSKQYRFLAYFSLVSGLGVANHRFFGLAVIFWRI